MRTANIDYFVGEDPLFGREEQDIQLPPAESGVGAHLAKSWETSIRQALMPVASNTSECSWPLFNVSKFLLGKYWLHPGSNCFSDNKKESCWGYKFIPLQEC